MNLAQSIKNNSDFKIVSFERFGKKKVKCFFDGFKSPPKSFFANMFEHGRRRVPWFSLSDIKKKMEFENCIFNLGISKNIIEFLLKINDSKTVSLVEGYYNGKGYWGLVFEGKHVSVDMLVSPFRMNK